MTSPPRVVLDTNLVLSALVFPAGRVASLRELWQQQQFLPLVSQPTLAELISALGYPKFRLTLAEQEELLADYLPFCTTIAIPNPPPPIPVCRDPVDVPFLQLAEAGQADAMVTGDQYLLALVEECDFLDPDSQPTSAGPLHLDRPLHPCQDIPPVRPSSWPCRSQCSNGFSPAARTSGLSCR